MFLQLRDTIRARERLWVRLYLGLVAVAVLAFAVAPIRTRILARVQQGVDAWNGRWLDRLAQGERMVADSQYAAAAAYLVTLDRGFPAQSPRHKWDKERERLLTALGTSYIKLGKKKLALETYHRLVAFDPHNYANNWALARAAYDLRPNWATPAEAKDQYLAALRLNPIDLPALDAYLQYCFEKAQWKEGSDAFEHYLDALQFEHVLIRVGPDSAVAVVDVDGRFHDVEVALSGPAEWTGVLALETHGISIEVKSVTLEGAVVTGVPGMATAPVWPAPAAWSADSMKPRGVGLYEALGTHTRVSLPIGQRADRIARVRLTLRLFKPVGADSWDTVDRSYRNKLNYAGLAATRARVLLPDVLNTQAY